VCACKRYRVINTKVHCVGGVLTPKIFQQFTAKAVPTGLAPDHHRAFHFVGVKFISREVLTTAPRLRRAQASVTPTTVGGILTPNIFNNSRLKPFLRDWRQAITVHSIL